MLKTILRKEHNGRWERRTPLTPSAVANLHAKGYQIDIERSDIRIFDDNDYLISPINAYDSPNDHQLVIGIKEPPVDSIMTGQVHLCFSHTIKGQDYNMPLLQKYIDQKSSLLDYELIVDETGKRTIAFGVQAGIAGAVDSFWIAGEKLKLNGQISELTKVRQTVEYQTIENLKSNLSKVNLQKDTPIRAVIIGSGNVGNGSEQVCQWLGLPKIDAETLINNQQPEGSWYCVVSSRHIHKRIAGGDFDYAEYMEKGKQAYTSLIPSLLGRFNILIQTSFWTEFYPRHLDNDQLIEYKEQLPWVLGDISCDIDGSFVCTQKASTTGNPAFSYNPLTKRVKDGIDADEMTVMSIGNLPCELSQDASEHFSSKLETYTPYLMDMNLNLSFEKLNLPEELKRSVIVYKGELTESFKYLSQFL